jgi:predicted ribosomally synthesized peptide with SipW-like signal peptide
MSVNSPKEILSTLFLILLITAATTASFTAVKESRRNYSVIQGLIFEAIKFKRDMDINLEILNIKTSRQIVLSRENIKKVLHD